MILFIILASYFVGALPFGYWITKAQGVDIQAVGSGNTGATNVARKLGWKLGLLTMLLDASKGAIPVVALRLLQANSWFVLLAGFLTLTGHCFSIFLKRPGTNKRFAGGKAVSTALGVVMAIAPMLGLFGLAVFTIVVLLTRIVSVSSTAAVSALFLYVYFTPQETTVRVLIAVITVLVLVRHRSNYRDLATGAELDKRFTRLPQLGAWPRWMIPRYWWAWVQMQIWKPDAHVLFMTHIIGEGPVAAKRCAIIRTPLGYLLPAKLAYWCMRYTPYWMRYTGCARVEIMDGGIKRIIMVHAVGVPWNTNELKQTHPQYPIAEGDMNNTMLHFLRVLPDVRVVDLGAQTAGPNRAGLELPGILEAAGFGHVTVVNGNSNTGGAALANTEAFHNQWVEAAPGRHGKKWRIAVLGGAGSVGSVYNRLIAKRGDLCSDLMIIGSSFGERKVVELVSELVENAEPGDPFIQEVPIADALQCADIVVTATNSAKELEALEALAKQREDIFFLDIGKPANVPKILCNDPRFLAVAGSIGLLPGRGRGFGRCIGLSGYLAYACCIEGVIVATAKLDAARWEWLLADVPQKKRRLAFLGNPYACLALKLRELSGHFGTLPCNYWLDPHTNLPICQSRVREFLERHKERLVLSKVAGGRTA